MVLIVVGVLIWNFSNTFQRSESPTPFSAFLKHVENKEVVSVTITGNEITGVMTTSPAGDGNTQVRTYAPTQFEELAYKMYCSDSLINTMPTPTSLRASLP